jgi:ribosome biogenesis protein Nip4
MYRKPTRNELTVLRRAFDKWGIFDFIENKVVLLNDLGHNKGKEVCLLSIALEAIIRQREPYYVGLKIGELKKNLSRLCREQTL